MACRIVLEHEVGPVLLKNLGTVDPLSVCGRFDILVVKFEAAGTMLLPADTPVIVVENTQKGLSIGVGDGNQSVIPVVGVANPRPPGKPSVAGCTTSVRHSASSYL